MKNFIRTGKKYLIVCNQKLLLIMRLSLFLLFMLCVSVFATGYSQDARINLDVKAETTVKSVLKMIEDQSGFRFFYNSDMVDLNKKITVLVNNKDINDALSSIFAGTSVGYRVLENNFVVLSLAEMLQQITITGTVTDNGEPMPGVNVLVKGTLTGTVTDVNGKYTIQAPDRNAVLVYSFIGYTTAEKTVGDQTTIDVALAEDTKQIEEVVVVAYGTQRKREVSGSMAQLSAEELGDLPVGQFAQKIQGRLPGVQITQNTGQPGKGMSFRIRGQASVNAGNSPLFVVDGFPITGDISNINPDEITSFTVLKDASATSLYGSRAANGVILVETKKGRPGRTQIDVNAYYGIQRTYDQGPDVMNAREWAQFKKEFYEDKIRYENWIDPNTGKSEVPDVYKNPEQYGEGTNWYRKMQRAAPVQNYNISINTGGEHFSSAIMLGYFKEEGILYNTSYERYSARANNEFKLNRFIKIGLNVAPSYAINSNHNTDGGWQILSAGILMSPICEPELPDGTMPVTFPEQSQYLFPNPNWYRVLKEKQDFEKDARLLSNAYVTVDILDGLQYRFRADIDMEQTNVFAFNPSTSGGAVFTAPPQKATGAYRTGFQTTWLTENMLSYRKEWKGHTFDALVGYTAQKYHWEGSTLEKTDYASDEIPWLNAAATTTGAEGSSNEWSLLSYLARLNYNYQGEYLLSLAFRRDGSSRFGADNKWGNFPSISAGWVISDENFMQGITPLSYLKLRASYGVVGNFNIGNYIHIANIGNSNYVFGNSLSAGKTLSNIGNPLLGWEETRQVDIGLDIGLFNDRIFFVYDYYKKVTDGLLYQINIPRGSGFSNIQSNIGQFDFWGHEFSINSRNIDRELTWNTNFNISFNRNKVIKLGSNDTPQGGYNDQEDFNRLSVGEPLGYFMGYIYDGVFMTEAEFNAGPKHSSSRVGTVRMKDIGGGPDGGPDGIIDENDRTKIGDPNPAFTYGMTTDFTWKGFDLSIAIAGSYGNDIMNNLLQYTENLDAVFNVRKITADRWRSLENPGKGEVPRTLAKTTELYRYNNTRWISDASYLAMKNITLGYTIPLKENEFIQRARVYLSAQNLFVLTNYEGGNPEVSVGGLSGFSNYGVDNTAYPIPTIFSLGVNVSF
jgi:TonB-linked SusC/RagA family outer membrane protein